MIETLLPQKRFEVRRPKVRKKESFLTKRNEKKRASFGLTRNCPFGISLASTT
jgi:hypothetical protein